MKESSLKDFESCTLRSLQRLSKGLNEATMIQCVILPLLQASGFDTSDPNQVRAEVLTSAGRADQIICAKRAGFVLEAKASDIRLTGACAQATAHAGALGIRWGIATNGEEWCFIDEQQPGSWASRIMLELRLSVKEEAEEISKLLSKSLWDKGEASVSQAWQEAQLRAVQRARKAHVKDRDEQHTKVHLTETHEEENRENLSSGATWTIEAR